MDLAAHKGDRTDRGLGMSVPVLTRRGDAALDDSDPSGDTPPRPRQDPVPGKDAAPNKDLVSQ